MPEEETSGLYTKWFGERRVQLLRRGMIIEFSIVDSQQRGEQVVLSDGEAADLAMKLLSRTAFGEELERLMHS